jgi:excisionase family DNA binding protein
MDQAKVDEVATDAVLFDRLKFLTSKEAAFLLRTSEGQVRNLVWSGRLRAYRYGNRLRFLRSDVEKVLKPAFKGGHHGS